MSKPNTQHIIGFDVRQYPIVVPDVVDVSDSESYAVKGYVTEGYWI